jgi:murein L,D-transpeptidase YcbB/YkuD
VKPATGVGCRPATPEETTRVQNPNRNSPTRLLTFLLALAFLPVVFATPSSPERDVIREHISQIRDGNAVSVREGHIASVIVLPALYERRDYALVWTNPRAADQLIDIIEHIDEDGLDSQDYHLSDLLALRTELSANADAATRAEYDLLLTDSLIRLGYHLQDGKVDPEELDTNWNMTSTLGNLDSILAMSRAIELAELPQLVDELRPANPIYARMKLALARYRQLEAQGGWPRVPDGPTLKPGMSGERVIALRERLSASEALPDGSASAEFDSSLEAAVKRFQQNHGLTTDGIVGPGTLAAMNVPVDARIDQIRANLERARWVLRNLPDSYVITDIAGFRVNLSRGGETVWSTRAQVGKPYRKTPVFRDTIRYLEVNPTWTVPPTILKQDTLPKIRKNPDYLRTRDMDVLTFSGKRVDPASIDWSQYPDKPFPYLIRQRPGPKNALGRIKFMFPNKHAVYLHDTPSRSLFGRDARAFSSGCIRVQHPFEFAELLLDDPAWTKEKLLEVVDSRKTTKIPLKKPIAVILLYWTVNADNDGNAVFKPDIYKRDARIVAALNSPFRFRSSPIISD